MVADTPVTYEVDPDGKFAAAIKEAAGKVTDLTIPFVQITKSWYQGNKAIFDLQGPGKYTDYKVNARGVSAYKKTKAKKLGSAYPMLRGFTRNLERSLTEAANGGAINRIVNKNVLMLGTKVGYAPYLQLGTKFMVPRPFMFIGGEQQAPGKLQTRRDLWVEAIRDYVKQVTGGVGSWKDNRS